MKTTITLRLGKRSESYDISPEQVAGIFDIIDNTVPGGRKVHSLPEIEKIVCDYFLIEGLATRRRWRDLVKARQIFFFLACCNSTKGLNAIGVYLGGFDHTTVLHARNKIRNLTTGRCVDEGLLFDLNEIKKLLNETI